MCLSLPYFVILSCLAPEFFLIKGKVLDLVFNGLTSPSASLRADYIKIYMSLHSLCAGYPSAH